MSIGIWHIETMHQTPSVSLHLSTLITFVLIVVFKNY